MLVLEGLTLDCEVQKSRGNFDLKTYSLLWITIKLEEIFAYKIGVQKS